MLQPSFWKRSLEEISSRRKSSTRVNSKVTGELRRWEKTVLEPWVRSFEERKEGFESPSGIPLKEFYIPDDIAREYLQDLGFPGEFPFTRGVYPTMYRGRLWTMRMFSGFGSPEDTNRRLKYLLKEGQTGLSLAFDMPTLYGYDCDHPKAYGEVGRCGVNVSSLQDMEVLLQDIPLDKVSTSMTINAPAQVLTCMYIAAGERQNVSKELLRGTVQADILKEYIAQKEWTYPPEAHMRLIRDMMVYCTKHMPLWNYLSISGYHIREAGANAAQELAFTLADGFAYVELGLSTGIDVDDFAPRLSFFFNADINFFEEIAKLRAARRIWARTMREKYGAENPRSMMLRFHTQTSGASLTWQQPLNNAVRTAVEALAAVLGGTQSLHTNSYDEAWALPTEEAVTLALRTQQIIAEETGISDVVDPLGGSYYVEWLTDELEEKAYKYFDTIESMGGVIQAIEKGYMQREIADSAYKSQQALEKGERKVVGVNLYRQDEKRPINILRVDPKVQDDQIRKIQLLRSRRDSQKVKQTLEHLRNVLGDNKANCMNAILEAVKAYATLGEITSVGREIFGEWREPVIA